MRGGARKLTSLDYISEAPGLLDATTCQNGEYYHDNVNSTGRMMEICQSGKNKTLFEYTEVNGVICQFLCPAPPGTFIKEDFIRLWSNATQWPNGTLPQAGDNVTLNGNWTVLLDIDPPALNYFVIDGGLIADDTRDVNVTANSIHVRAGNITAGSPGNRFLHNFVIQLNGFKNLNEFYIDPIVAGNKYLVVTGSLNLHGVTPGTVQTVLTQTAVSGSSTISVDSSTDWAVGDTIVLSSSFSGQTEHEKRTISSLNADGSISLDSPLLYTHYGASGLTIDNSYGQLDTRTRVGHVSRNVRIVNGPDSGWGFTVNIYGYKDTDNVTRIGDAQLTGVQFENGGQLDTLNPALKFLNLKGGSVSNINGVSFIGCQASCIRVENSDGLIFKTNVLYDVWVIGLQATITTKLTVTNNLVIGVRGRPTLPEGNELTACLAFVEYPAQSAQVTIQNNYCHGSTQHGFAVTFVGCDEAEVNPFANNTVGSAAIGFILNTNGQQCQLFSYAKAFACGIGQISGSPGITTIMFTQFLMADNQRAMSLK
jgi:hypothetical protein